MHQLLVLFLIAFLTSCSKTQNTLPNGPWVPALDIPNGQSRPVTLSNGSEIVIHHIGGKYFYLAEGALTDQSFLSLSAQFAYLPQVEKKALILKKLESATAKIKTNGGIILSQHPEVGYFNFLVPYAENIVDSIRALKMEKDFLIHPVFYERFDLGTVKSFSPFAEGLEYKDTPRLSTDDFSGLKRIQAPEFVKLAANDILDGAQGSQAIKVDGSLVKIGITDTGITFNHPTFQSINDKKNKIQYLKDYTREGRVYFHPKAKFEAKIPDFGTEEDLLIKAEVLMTPRLPNLPLGDDLVSIEGLRIKVSPALQKILLTPGNGAKLGVLSEDAFQSTQEQVDLNANGKLEDNFFIIRIPGNNDEDVIYVDTTGIGDFRNSEPIGSWNKTQKTVSFFSEKVGFDFGVDQLPNKNGTDTVEVKSVSLVGFDPGNHGSHVSGIAAGSKTITNDKNLTLARGVAPEAKILMNRVCANNGGCGATEAFIDLVVNAKAEVINMSLGGLSAYNDGYGFQEMMINRLSSLHNVLFVISAGNSGPGRQTVGSPSVARHSLSVGASASKSLIERQYQWPGLGSASLDINDDFLLFFSSRGPTAAGGFKPNLVTPGTELSSIQLNAPPGARAGLDVYWGTSMAAPTATGAYALLLDAIKKYNSFHPGKELTTNALLLRQILISSAKAFDVNRFDPETLEKAEGQYTWIDQGTGILDLVAAWKMLFKFRDKMPPTAVTYQNKPVELDYKILIPTTGPNGIAYDGSRMGDVDSPAFGTGLFLDAKTNETLRRVYISRLLPDNLMNTPEAAELLGQQLFTSRDEFVLKTVIYGSDKRWLKVGVLDQLNCSDSEMARFTVIGKGAGVSMNSDGSGTLVPVQDSLLAVCLNRELINELPPGDHGVLIYAYRAVDDTVSPLPSFIIPVFLSIPHRTLANSSAYEVQSSVNSFGVKRHYVEIPKGTSAVKITLEVPLPKLTQNGNIASGENCSGVELMALEGDNITNPIKSRKNARISNCAADGTPLIEVAKRKLGFTRINPKPGIWDLHVFGQYRYLKSQYKLRVDYVIGESNLEKIAGSVSALTGSFNLKIKEASFQIALDQAKSSFVLDSLWNHVLGSVNKDETVYVEGPLGIMRAYPPEASLVTITTGESPGNDIDLNIFECAKTATSPQDSSCKVIAQSGGSTDEEQASFQPRVDRLYAVSVVGYSINNVGAFASNERIFLQAEKGELKFSESENTFQVEYGFTQDQINTSKLLKNELFLSKKCQVAGGLMLKTTDGLVLKSIPVEIGNLQ